MFDGLVRFGIGRSVLHIARPLDNMLPRGILVAVAMLTLSFGSAMAEVPSAQLYAVFPPGAKQGSTVDVAIAGAHLDGVSQLRFSHPGITAVQKSALSEFSQTQQAVPNQFTLTIASDVPAGNYDAYAIGLFGISNPRRFVVSDRPEIIDNQVATTLHAANEITIGSIVNAKAPQDSVAYYKFQAKAGQRLLVDCAAYRIDSRMDATLALLDASGEVLAQSRNVNRRDPLLDFTAKVDGEYFVKVYDYTFGGGDDYFFRLSVHDRPYIDFIFPPAGLAGESGKYFIYGRNLPGGMIAEDALVDRRPLERLAVEIRIPDDAAARSSLADGDYVEPVESGLDGFDYTLETSSGKSNPRSLGFATAPVVLEQEPENNDKEHPQKVTLPCEIVGQFYPRGDEDWYVFDGKKGDVYWIEAMAQQLGQPADPYVLLQRVSTDDQGEEKVTLLQELDDRETKRMGGREPVFKTDTDDPLYRFQVPEDGLYRILIRDRYNRSRGDPRLIYRLSIRREQPDFRLVAIAESPSVEGGQVFLWNNLLRKDGVVPIRVVVFRRDGFNGPIDLSVAGLPAGVTASDITIAGGQSSAHLLLCSEDPTMDWTGVISIIGKATIGEVEVLRRARSGGVVWGAPGGDNETPRSRVFREIALGVTSCEPAPLVVRIGEGQTWQMSRGGKLEIPVGVECEYGLNGELRLEPANVPPKLSVGRVEIKATEREGKVEVGIGADATPGMYTFSIKTEARLNYRRYPEAVEIANQEKEDITKIALELADASVRAIGVRQSAEQMSNDANAKLNKVDEALATAETGAQDELQAARDAAAAEAEKLAVALGEADALAQAAAEKAERAKAAKELAEANAEKLVKLSELVNMRYMIFAKPMTIEVIDPPFSVAEIKAPDPLVQSKSIEIPVTISRIEGYEEEVEVSVQLPDRLQGLQVAKLTIPAGQTEGVLNFEANADASLGDHQVTLVTRFVYNKRDMQTTSQFALKVAAAANPESK